MTTASAHPPLSRVLTRMNLLVSGTGLLLACVLFASYDVMTFRNALLAQLSSQAQVVAANSVSALLFDDPRAATDTLSALRDAPNVLSAQLFTAGRKPFAQFRADGSPVLPALAPLADGSPQVQQWTWTTVVVTRRIQSDGKTVGFVAVEADLAALYRRLGQYLAIAALVLLISLAATLFIARFAQRSISTPMGTLAGLARQISQRDDFDIRAPVATNAPLELSVLTEAFNDMVAAIAVREGALKEARNTLEKRVQQRTTELEASNRELESFSYSVSHDLRAPLRHVAGFANMLQVHAAASLDDKGQRYLTTIVDAAARMGRLIDDLLAFSRMGRASLTTQAVDLDVLLREARAEVAPEASGRDVAWEIAPLPSVDADPSLLRPAIVNLLSNAVKYSGKEAQPRIEVGTEPAEDGSVVVYVRDNGVGFDMQYVDKLFGIFQRLHASHEFSGTGIGLANVRRIIERHGGRTWAVGAVGAGATFYFSLPARRQGASCCKT